jgi:hypothetical protein
MNYFAMTVVLARESSVSFSPDFSPGDCFQALLDAWLHYLVVRSTGLLAGSSLVIAACRDESHAHVLCELLSGGPVRTVVRGL